MALPDINDLIGSGVTESGFKTALQQFLENVAGLDFVNQNHNFKFDQINSGDSLTSYTTEGVFYKIGDTDITEELGYPVLFAGVLRVYTFGSGTSAVLIHEYTVWHTTETYKNCRVGGVWKGWNKIETTSSAQAKIDSAIKLNASKYQWFIGAFGISPVFDVATKTLSWSSSIYAPSQNHSGNRIYIPAGSFIVDTDAVSNGVLYLDLNAVPVTGTLAVEDIQSALVYASYPTYRGNPRFIPLAKPDQLRNSGKSLIACEGFLPIRNSFDPQRLWLRGRTLEWLATSATVSPTFDKATKTLSWGAYILATYRDDSSIKRIRIASISVQFANNYEFLYIDTSVLNSSTKDITQADVGTVLKIGSYSNSFEHSGSQIPIAKYDATRNQVYPCAGFLNIVSVGDEGTGNAGSLDYFQFLKTAGTLSCYLPTSSGKKLKIGLIHLTRPFDVNVVNSQADLWRLYRAVQCNETSLDEEIEVVNPGEWECALKVLGENDYVGGYHGDELLTDVMFYVDGVQYSQDFISSGKFAKEIILVQKSIIYFENTQTPLAEHLKYLKINKDGVLLKQNLKFVSEANLANAQVTMLPILRTNGAVQISDFSSRSNDYFLQVDDNTNEGFLRRYTPIYDGSSVKIWGSSSKYSAEVIFNKTANYSPNQNVYIYNGGGYNKLYASPINGADSTGTLIPIGTEWDIETFYKMDIAI